MDISTLGASILIIRIWFEGDPPTDFRARVIQVADTSSEEQPTATVATAGDLIAAVQTWVEQLTPR